MTEPDKATAADGGTTPRRIFLAEDEAIIRLDLRETLESLGHMVVGETGRGDEVIDGIERCEPDVAIVDIKMPGRDGISVARELTDRRMCAVLILSAFSQRDLVQEAAEAGVLSYLVKPFHQNELMAAIEVANAQFTHLAQLHGEVELLNDRLETRKIIDRAKGRLIDVAGLSEEQAFAFIQKRAMSGRSKMRVVAEGILSGEIAPD